MAALRAAKQALRKEIKRRVAALSDQEKTRQSSVVSQKVKTEENHSSTCVLGSCWSACATRDSHVALKLQLSSFGSCMDSFSLAVACVPLGEVV